MIHSSWNNRERERKVCVCLKKKLMTKKFVPCTFSEIIGTLKKTQAHIDIFFFFFALLI